MANVSNNPFSLLTTKMSWRKWLSTLVNHKIRWIAANRRNSRPIRSIVEQQFVCAAYPKELQGASRRFVAKYVTVAIGNDADNPITLYSLQQHSASTLNRVEKFTDFPLKFDRSFNYEDDPFGFGDTGR